MLNPIIGDSRIELLNQALTGLAQRQQAIAGNIANVDTPGYQRRDVPFEQELRASLGTGGARLATTSPRHIPVARSTPSLLETATQNQGRSRTGRNDGNNVDIDYEMTQLAETSLRYQLLTELTSARFTTLRDIVSKAV
jgi:flagellar basal-body rod protein FlgB